MKKQRLQILILSPIFYISVTLLALNRSLSRSTCFGINSIISRFVFITSGLMIIYYTRRLNILKGNHHRNTRLLGIFKQFRNQWMQSRDLFDRFRTKIWRIRNHYFYSDQYIKILPTKSAFISSYNSNQCHTTTSERYLPFTNDILSNIDERQTSSRTFSESNEQDSNSLYIEEDIDPLPSLDTVTNRSLSSPIKFYTADRKLPTDTKTNSNKQKIINDNLRSDNNQLIISKNVSTTSITSVEFILTPTCSANALEPSLSHDNNKMIDTIKCTSNRSIQCLQKISSSMHGLRTQSSCFLLNSFRLISKRRLVKWNKYLTSKRHHFF